jgi:hypothetical protein
MSGKAGDAVKGAITGATIGARWGWQGAIVGAIIGGALGYAASCMADTSAAGGPRQDIQMPSNVIGEVVPDLIGTGKVCGTYLCFGLENVEEETSGGGGCMGGSEEVTGYKYYMSWAQALCIGPVDTVYSVYKDNDTILWAGELNRPETGGKETITIDGYGTITFYFGTDDQPADDVMSSLIPEPTLNSNLKGLCYAVFNNFYIGDYNRCPSITFTIKKTPVIAELTANNTVGDYDYNPIHAIWYILTKWTNLPVTWLNTADFISVASTIKSEGLGVSFLFDRYQNALGYVETINSHIFGILRYGSDGKFHPKLLRNDYTAANLPLVDETIVLDDPSLSRKSWIDTINEVKVEFSEVYIEEWSKEEGESEEEALNIKQSTASPSALDKGNYTVQGRLVSKTVQLANFTNNRNAVWASREFLRRESYPLASVTFPANRNAFRLEVGDCFRFSYAKYGVTNMVCRVVQLQEEGPESENIIITAMEDVYSLSSPITDYTEPIRHNIPRQSYPISPFVNQKVYEVPYLLDTDQELKVLPLACRAKAMDLGFNVHLSIDGGTSYDYLSNIPLLYPYGTLPSTYSSDTYNIDSDGIAVNIFEDASKVVTSSLDKVIPGLANVALLGEEIISFQTITPVSGERYQLTNVIRGRFGTEKATHVSGESLYFINSVNEIKLLTSSEFVVDATRNFKFVPYNVRNSDSLSNASALSLSLVGKSRTPYKPINFAANGSSFAARYDSDVVLTWSPRARGYGAGIGVPGEVLSVLSGEGYFSIEVYSGETKRRTVEGLTNPTWTYTSAMNIADNGLLLHELTFKLSNYKTFYSKVYESAQVEVVCKKN